MSPWRWAGALALVGAAAFFRGRRFKLAGKIALVTGGSRGLGLAVARELGRRGARVAICGRDEARLARARALLEEEGIHVFARVCDVTRRDEVEALVADVRGALGPVDVLVNNAGIIQVGPLEAMTEHDFGEALAVHLWGSIWADEAVVPDMRRRRRGRIVHIASIGGLVAVPHLLPYCVSKFALVGLSDGLRSELGREGIKVLTVCPGLMRTGSPRGASFKGKHRAEYAWFALSASAPLISMGARRAARRIARALVRGRARVVLGTPARLLALAQSLAPELLAKSFAAVARLLPKPGGIGIEARTGAQSESLLTRSPLTFLGQRAGKLLNQGVVK